MHDKEVAELVTRIVSSALQGGALVGKEAKDVCNFYAAIHAQVLACAKTVANDTSFPNQAIEPTYDIR